MKRIIPILTAFFLITGVLEKSVAQSSFFHIYGTPNEDLPSNAVQINNNCFFVRNIRGMFDGKTIETRLVKVNPNNEIMESGLLNIEDYDANIIDHIVVHDNLVYGLAISTKNLSQYFMDPSLIFTVCDTNLNILLQKEYELPFDELGDLNLHKTIYANQSILFVMQDKIDYSTYVFKFDLQGNCIFTGHLYSEKKPTLLEITPDTYSKGYYLLYQGRWFQENAETTLMKVDSSFNYVSHSVRKGHPEFIITRCAGLQLIDSSTFISSASGSRLWGNGTPYFFTTLEYGILTFDNEFSIHDSLYPDTHHMKSDTISASPQRTGMAYYDANNIYCAHEINFWCSYDFFPTCYDYFKVYKIDTALNLKWLYMAGGDANYVLFSITATDDGGCFVLGERYDYMTQNEEHDIFYIKTDSTGIILHKSDNAPALHNAAVFPNPGNDYFELQAGPQIFGATFELFDLNGRLVKKETITSQNTTVSTTNLASGTYVWRIIYKNKEVETGKWVKSL
jgi:hypothetical protein